MTPREDLARTARPNDQRTGRLRLGATQAACCFSGRASQPANGARLELGRKPAIRYRYVEPCRIRGRRTVLDAWVKQSVRARIGRGMRFTSRGRNSIIRHRTARRLGVAAGGADRSRGADVTRGGRAASSRESARRAASTPSLMDDRLVRRRRRADARVATPPGRRRALRDCANAARRRAAQGRRLLGSPRDKAQSRAHRRAPEPLPRPLPWLGPRVARRAY